LIKEGNIYDVIFMDQMMPVMGGIEAVQTIRDMGYTAPIVALTANAVVGQMDKFLTSGFDDFISKPIDPRRLNVVMKKYVRDTQPPEVLEKARALINTDGTQTAEEKPKSTVRPHLADFFVRDAAKAVPILQSIINKNGRYSEDDYHAYANCTHAMRTALLNIGEVDLSVVAGTLEQAAKEKKTDRIFIETPAFLSKLRVVITNMTPPEGDNENENVTEADYEILRKELLTVITACEEYDKKTAKDSIMDLREKPWPHTVKEQLGTMSEALLSGDFDEVTLLANNLIDSS
jgi:CheY-like chemotaxis protein